MDAFHTRISFKTTYKINIPPGCYQNICSPHVNIYNSQLQVIHERLILKNTTSSQGQAEQQYSDLSQQLGENYYPHLID